MPQISTNQKYTITSSFLGPSNNLASTLNTDTVIVESSDLKASQQWYFTSSPVDGYYYFHTSQKGDYVLDIRGYDGEDTLSIHFHNVDTERRMVGQYWMIGEWSDGSARISNNFTGADVLLDVEKLDGEFIALLANADQRKTGQKWSFGIVGVEASASETQTLSTTSATATKGSATSTLITSTSIPTPSSTKMVTSSNAALNKGTIGGIIAAGVVGLILLAGLGFFLRQLIRRGNSNTVHDEAIPRVSRDA